jgi:hypothetical protein
MRNRKEEREQPNLRKHQTRVLTLLRIRLLGGIRISVFAGTIFLTNERLEVKPIEWFKGLPRTPLLGCGWLPCFVP